MNRVACGLSSEDAGVDSFAEAAGRAALGLGGAGADVALVFAGAPNLAHAEDGLAIVRERLGARVLAGCGAQGVVGAGREVESGGVAVWAGSLPEAEVESFHLEAFATDAALAVAGMPDLDDTDTMILLADPYSFPVEPLLGQIAVDHPGLPVIGGIASVAGGPGEGVLLHDDELLAGGAVGVTLRGVEVRPCVSQGARPIGPEMVITAGDENLVQELASKPALERLKEAIAELDPSEQALAARGLLIGIVIDENQPEYGRGDFLVRGLVAVDEEEGTVTVGERVRVGQTVRLHVRDGASADEDLRAALEREAREVPDPAGALLFTCNGRGSHMFGAPDHDATLVEELLRGAPAGGFFCAGEIGPVGDRNFLHGFTATLAVFGR